MIYLFDLDGTIIDSQIGITRGISYALKKMGLPSLPQDKLVDFIGPNFIEAFPKAFGISLSDTRRMITFYRQYYGEVGFRECRLYEGMYEILKDLNLMGKRVFMATAKPENSAKKICDYLGISEFFEDIVGALEDESRYKKEDVIQEIVNRHGPFESAFMIGDRASDIRAAKIKGLSNIGVLYGFAKEGEIEKEAPDFICDRPASLKKLILEDL